MNLPILANSQAMASQAVQVDVVHAGGPPAFLIRDHGLYAWGADMDRALAAVEAVETLLACELELIKAGGKP